VRGIGGGYSLRVPTQKSRVISTSRGEAGRGEGAKKKLVDASGDVRTTQRIASAPTAPWT
jgi:hypothetical protein